MNEPTELAVRYMALRMWQDLISRMDYQPSNRGSFIAAVTPQIQRALEEAYERTKREGQRAEAGVDQSQAVGRQLEPGVQKPACEWGGGVCR